MRVIWNAGLPVFHFMVRYTHNNVKKTIGTFKNLREATAALAAAKAKDIMNDLPRDWEDTVTAAVEALLQLRNPESLREAALSQQFGGRRNVHARMAELAGPELQHLLTLTSYLPPHELMRGHSANYVDEDTGEVTTIPAWIVTQYVDQLEQQLMEIKHVGSATDRAEVHQSTFDSTFDSNHETFTFDENL